MTEAQVLERRRWTALALLAVAQFVVVLDAAIVNVALPTIPTPAPPAPHGHEGRRHSTGGVGIRAASP